jgi:hypothetical protein
MRIAAAVAISTHNMSQNAQNNATLKECDQKLERTRSTVRVPAEWNRWTP